jgi:hypothetical protein
MIIRNVTARSDEELRALPDSGADPGSRNWETAKLEMELRTSERQLQTSKTLAKFTSRLVFATWVLAGATIALVAVTGLQAYLVWKQYSMREEFGFRIF